SPRESDFQHLHQPGPDGARLQHPYVAARQGGDARGRDPEPCEGRVPESGDLEAAWVSAAFFGADIQRVRRRDSGSVGEARQPSRRPEDPGRRAAFAIWRSSRSDAGRGDGDEHPSGNGSAGRCPGKGHGVSVELEEKKASPGDRLHPEPRHEPLVFERSGHGKIGYSLPVLDVPEVVAIPPSLLRREIPGETEISEVEVARHFTRLSRLNFSIDEGLYPLGSCTMKHNPRTNEEVARLPGFAAIHPLAPEEVTQGALEL